MKIKFLTIAICLGLLSLDSVHGYECTQSLVGESICEKYSPFFDDYQYATCVPASYILEQSLGFFQCENVQADYCWYKCMTEQYGLASGSVQPECTCSPGSANSSTTTKPPNPKPPKKCYDNNNDCSFYLDCLSQNSPNCTSFMNSLEYATIFCGVYQQNYTNFSLRGKSWLNAAEKCFQVNMKPLMSASNKKKCKEQKKDLKKKKASCYLTPGKKDPSICDLECTDWYRIFWTLKNESDVFTLAEDLSEFLRLFKGCKELSRCTNDSYVPTVAYKFKFKGKYSIKKANTNDEDFDSDLDTVAASVADSIAQQMRLNPSDFDIFSFVNDPDNPIAPNELHVNTWILSKKDFYADSWENSYYLKKIDQDLSIAIRFGTISLSVELNGQKIGLSAVDPCKNDMCTKTGPTINYNSMTVTTSNPDNASSSRFVCNWSLIIGITLWINIFKIGFIYI